jgi:hypothetical protein
MLLKFAVEINRFQLKAEVFLKREKAIVRDERALQMPEIEQENILETVDCAETKAERLLEFERLHRWNALIIDAQHARRRIRKSITLMKSIVRELKEADIDMTSPDLQEKFKAVRNSKWKQGAMFSELTRLGVNPDQLKAVMKLVLKDEKCPDIKLLLKDLVTLSDNFSKKINERMLKAGSDDEQDEAITFDIDSLDSALYLILPPLAPGYFALGGAAVLVLIGAALALRAFFEFAFNATDDDNARDTVQTSPCGDIGSMTRQARLDLITPMLSGPTGDEDESAILRILNCSTCEDVSIMVDSIGLTNLLDEFNGSEWDRLVLRLTECGRLSVSDWDDDATRLFILSSECSTLNRLSLPILRRLMLNMFAGSTGDADENAIIKLIRCLPCSKVQALTSMPNMSYDDFDDVVDGDEWDRLERTFRTCGVRG